VFNAAPDDNAAIGQPGDVPTLDPPTSLGGTTLYLDQTGSFQVLAFVDANRNGRWDLGETGLALPLVLVQASLHRNLTLNPVTVVSYRPTGDPSGKWNLSTVAAGGTLSPAGACGFNPGQSTAGCAVILAAEIDFLGGSGDGLRGATQVFGGWVQTVNPDVTGFYQNNHKDVIVFASNVPASHPPFFLPNPPTTDPAPLLIAGPLLDSLSAQPGTGGNSSLMPSSQQGLVPVQLLGATPDPAPSLGTRTVVTAPDDPSQPFPAQHAIVNNYLTDITDNLSFLSYLAVWSSASGTPDNVDGTPAPSGAIADRTYGVILQQPWSIRSTFSNIDALGSVQTSVSTVSLGQPLTLNNKGVAPIASTGAVLVSPTAQSVTGHDMQH